MDFGVVLVFLIPPLIIGYLMANGETGGGLGCLGAWIAVSILVALTMEGATAGQGLLIAAVASVLPALGAAVGYNLNNQRSIVGQERRTKARRNIPTSARSIGKLWYGGGIPAFQVIMAELLLTDKTLWLAAVQPAEVAPVRIPLNAIETIEVDSDIDISTRTDVAGGVIWGGGGARRTESVTDPKLLIRWRIDSGGVQEVEFKVNSPLPSSREENRKASALGTNVAEVRQIRAAIVEALPNEAGSDDREVEGRQRPEDDRLPCPWCAEPIRKAAKICMHCDRDVKTGERV